MIAFRSCISNGKPEQLLYFIVFCVRGTRTQPLICFGCPLQLIGEVFFEIAFVVVVDTHLLRFEALGYVLLHFDALTLVMIRVFSAFIFQTFADVCYSIFVNRLSFKSVLNLRKAYIFKSGCQRKPGKMLKMSTEGGQKNKVILTS